MRERQPVKLTSPRVWRTYLGGSRIDRIHGIWDSQDSQFPEEWIMSTVTARNPGREAVKDEGLCYLEGTTHSLKDYILCNPEAALGKKHIQRHGITTGVLAKILDAAERLTIQVHPNREKALELFGSAFGKTECWHILDCRSLDGEEPCIYLGFRENITRAHWEALFHSQDIPAMLSCLHKIPVKPGQTYLVKAGVPHAIGAGCLLLEIQEPTDYTVRTERISPSGLVIDDRQCHQGLGFERMFECFVYEGCSFRKALDQWRIEPVTLEETAAVTRIERVGAKDTPCFSLESLQIRDRHRIDSAGRCYGLYILQGQGCLHTAHRSIPVQAGDQFFVPADCDAYTIQPETPIQAFCCFGPDS